MRRNYLKLIVIFLMVCSHPVSAGIFGHWFNQCQSLGARKVNIHTIQGTDDVSPIVGQDVEVQGIITAVAPQLKGFFIQEEAKDMDGNPKTSEGLFVFSQILPDIEVGHIVSVRGEVQEHFGMTQIKAIGGWAMSPWFVMIDPALFKKPKPQVSTIVSPLGLRTFLMCQSYSPWWRKWFPFITMMTPWSWRSLFSPPMMETTATARFVWI